MEKLLSVSRIISDSPNQPNLPRQLKNHIAFSMFPILDTNLWLAQKKTLLGKHLLSIHLPCEDDVQQTLDFRKV